MEARKSLKRLQEEAEGRDIRQVLIEDYDNLGSQVALAEKHGVNQSTISYWFSVLGLRIKPRLVMDSNKTLNINNGLGDS